MKLAIREQFSNATIAAVNQKNLLLPAKKDFSQYLWQYFLWWYDIWNGSYMNCEYEIKWRYDPRSYERDFCNCIKKAEKFGTSINGIWTRDLAIPVWRSNQPSYEATDVGSWSFVGANVPMRNESMMKWYMKWIIYELRIWNQVKPWSSQLWTRFLQLRKEAWKIQDFSTVTLNPPNHLRNIVI